MSRKTLLTSIICGLIAFVVQPLTVAAAGPSLAGSWQIMLTPTTAVPPVAVPGLVTFTTDGSVIETDGSEVVPGIASTATGHTFGTAGHGIWQLGPCRCNFYVQYLSLVVNEDGSLAGTNVTTLTVTLTSNGAQFGGTYATVQEAGGTTKQISSGAINGNLIPHPKLP